jgi:hypothetical protein
MQQGNLDGLCGFYSVINAITGAANLNTFEVEILAQELRPLINITEVWNGCSIKTLRAMVTAGIAWVNQQRTCGVGTHRFWGLGVQ